MVYTSLAMNNEQFDAVVKEAIVTLPDNFKQALENIAIFTEDEPTEDHLTAIHHARNVQLFGLYQGVPLTKRAGSLISMPDRITLFRGPITRSYDTPEEIRKQIRSTVLHEIGHYFGLSEDQLRKINKNT